MELSTIDQAVLNNLKKRLKTKTKVTLPKQIVNNDLTGREEKPLDSRFLGEKNQIFDRQTIPSKVDIFKKASRGTKKGVATGKEKAPNKRKAIAKPAKKMSLADFGLGKKALEVPKVDGQSGDLESSRLGQKRGNAATPALAANNDYIEDIPLGDMANLNTVEFKYYGFYHRIRQKLEQHWGNSLREKAERLFHQGRSLARNTHVTSVTLKLDSKGNILNIVINSTSGVKELDDAAVESFNKAGPFPNPPRGMLVNGEATIKWGFVVKG